MLVLPDSTKEAAKKVKLPIVVAAGHKRGMAYGRAMLGALIADPLKGDPKPVVELSSDSEGEHDKSTLTKNPEIDWDQTQTITIPNFSFVK